MSILTQPWLIYLFVVPLALVVARWFFRSVQQEVARRNAPSAWGTRVLPWLRAILAGLLVLGFAQPFYTRKTPVLQPGQVAVVLDTESGIAQAPAETQADLRLRLMRNLNLIGEKEADFKAMSLADAFTEAMGAMKGAADGDKRKKRLALWREFVDRQKLESHITEAGRLPSGWKDLVQKKLVDPTAELGEKPSDESIKRLLEDAAELRKKLRARVASGAPTHLAAPAVAAASAKLQQITGWERLRKLLGGNGLLRELSQDQQVTLYLWQQGRFYRWWNGSPDSIPEISWPELSSLPVASADSAGALTMEDFNAGFNGARRVMVLFSALGSDSAAPGSLATGFRPGAYPVHAVTVGASGSEGRVRLREIASQSNGQLLPEAEADRLPSMLAGLVRQKTERQTYFFFHHAALYLLAVALFLTEIFLRKRHGLL